MDITNLKCAECGEEAEYLVNGTSYCKAHLPKKKSIENPKFPQFPPSTGASGLRV